MSISNAFKLVIVGVFFFNGNLFSMDKHETNQSFMDKFELHRFLVFPTHDLYIKYPVSISIEDFRKGLDELGKNLKEYIHAPQSAAYKTEAEWGEKVTKVQKFLFEQLLASKKQNTKALRGLIQEKGLELALPYPRNKKTRDFLAARDCAWLLEAFRELYCHVKKYPMSNNFIYRTATTATHVKYSFGSFHNEKNRYGQPEITAWELNNRFAAYKELFASLGMESEYKAKDYSSFYQYNIRIKVTFKNPIIKYFQSFF